MDVDGVKAMEEPLNAATDRGCAAHSGDHCTEEVQSRCILCSIRKSSSLLGSGQRYCCTRLLSTSYIIYPKETHQDSCDPCDFHYYYTVLLHAGLFRHYTYITLNTALKVVVVIGCAAPLIVNNGRGKTQADGSLDTESSTLLIV